MQWNIVYEKELTTIQIYATMGFPSGTSGKNVPANAEDVRDVGSISGSGRCPGEGHSNLFQSSCLENPMDRGAWQAAALRVAQSWT